LVHWRRSSSGHPHSAMLRARRMQHDTRFPTIDWTSTPHTHSSSTPRPNTLGGWLFRQRSWLPAPFALMLVVVRWHVSGSRWPRIAGIALVFLGEFLRLWSVRHIGVISRTRAARLGPLVATGPYLLTRNPLYVGNAMLWCGFVAWSGLLWMEPVAGLVFAGQYGLLVRWEERLLAGRFGSHYDDYRRRVPRWTPGVSGWYAAWHQPASHAWGPVLFSERGTLLTIAIMAILLTLKHAWP
jgi:protein-S-isoprenylcysteine O-methyltransferase Ste14